MNGTAPVLFPAYTLALTACWWLHRTLPKRHRLRAMTFLMTLPVVVIAMTATSDPLPAIVPIIQTIWRGGPAG